MLATLALNASTPARSRPPLPPCGNSALARLMATHSGRPVEQIVAVGATLLSCTPIVISSMRG